MFDKALLTIHYELTYDWLLVYIRFIIDLLWNYETWLWFYYGLTMECVCICNICLMDLLRIYYVFIMYLQCISNGFAMRVLWLSYVCTKDLLRSGGVAKYLCTIYIAFIMNCYGTTADLQWTYYAFTIDLQCICNVFTSDVLRI